VAAPKKGGYKGPDVYNKKHPNHPPLDIPLKKKKVPGAAKATAQMSRGSTESAVRQSAPYKPVSPSSKATYQRTRGIGPS
jgi:hypothetical protein